MTIHGLPGAPHRQALFAVVALGLALGASATCAQAVQTASGSDAAASGSNATDNGDPDAVVVHGQRRHPPRTYGVPPEKAEAFAGKSAAWREYRDSTPFPTPGSCPIPPDPSQGAGCGTLEGSKDYPGLRNIGQ
jgi:hypothetical protein